MYNVNKRVFLASLNCPRQGWMERNGVRKAPSVHGLYIIEQGQMIGERARECFPGGVLIEGHLKLSEAIEQTAALLNDPTVQVIFEAAFRYQDAVARADILQRDGEGWHLIEVKSATKIKKETIDDLAYTAMILKHCGVKCSRLSLMFISKDYRQGMPPESLFVCVDRTVEAGTRAAEFSPNLDTVCQVTARSQPPKAILSLKCKECDLFSECHPDVPEYNILLLPRINENRCDPLLREGIVDIHDVSPYAALTENQMKYVRCVQTGEICIENRLSEELDTIKWPVHYLDFETMNPAIPPYPDVAPYQQTPTQYSIHICTELGAVPDHREYLADHECDCRRELTERLIDDLDGDGSVLIYSHFENDVFNTLKAWFPDLEVLLSSISNRFVDLEKIVKSVNHPEFRGSTSIKVTMPALVPELSYEGLDINDGGSAMAVFANMVQGKYSPEEIVVHRKNLLEYCKLDTYAMVRLHEILCQL